MVLFYPGKQSQAAEHQLRGPGTFVPEDARCLAAAAAGAGVRVD